MRSPFGSIKYTYGLQSRYFAVAKADIRDTNLQLLKRMCLLELVFVSAFICLSMAVFPGWKPTYQYWGFLIAAAGVTALIYLCVLLKKTTYTAVMLLCVLFYITTLSGCIAVDALTGSTNTAVFFQIVIVVLPAVFVLPFTVMFPMNAGLEALYVVLLWYNKDAGYARMDTFSSLAGFFFSIIVMVSVSNLRASEGLSKMRYIRQGTTDPLTQVLNRAECEERMREYFSYRRRNDAPCALLMFDIDNFKNVNDEYGHQTGDQALTLMGNVLRGCFRGDDIVGRIGGDEFMVLVRNIREKSSLGEIVERIQSDIRGISELPRGLRLSSSLGVAFLSGTAAYEEMYRVADRAMYEAKRSAAGQCVIKEL
jgi:diguanylate cyclase (GGDEF)-like protein